MNDSLAQLVEHNTFNVGVMGSNPMRVTERESCQVLLFCLFTVGYLIGHSSSVVGGAVRT